MKYAVCGSSGWYLERFNWCNWELCDIEEYPYGSDARKEMIALRNEYFRKFNEAIRNETK